MITLRREELLELPQKLKLQVQVLLSYAESKRWVIVSEDCINAIPVDFNEAINLKTKVLIREDGVYLCTKTIPVYMYVTHEGRLLLLLVKSLLREINIDTLNIIDSLREIVKAKEKREKTRREVLNILKKIRRVVEKTRPEVATSETKHKHYSQ